MSEIIKDYLEKKQIDCCYGEIRSIKDAMDIVCGGLGDNGKYPEHPNILEPLLRHKNKSYSYTYKFPWGIWFRGSSNNGYNLHPSIFRSVNKNEFFKEGAIYSSFKLYNPSYEQTHNSDFDWLTLMQHYKLPTRLLDWTENILSALYFASKESKSVEKADEKSDKKADGKLYLLNARRLNRIFRFKKDKIQVDVTKVNAGDKGMLTPGSVEVRIVTDFVKGSSKQRVLHGLEIENRKSWVKKYDPAIIPWLKHKKEHPDFLEMENKTTAAHAVFPSRKNVRMQAQQSMFTLHGGKLYVDNEREYDENEIFGLPRDLIELNIIELKKGNPFLMAFHIPNECKENIQEELRRIGIHEGFLYPEIENQSEHLKKIWSFPESF